MTIRLDGQVAIVTGAGTGLGRSHAHALAARGAKVVVNDLGSGVGDPGSLSGAAQEVAVEIEAAGGKAIAIEANVADFRQIQGMVSETLDVWGRVDILINNAGNLRDKSFAKMTPEGFPGRNRRPSDGFVQLHQKCLGRHARTAIRSHRHDNFQFRPLRQLRPGKLRRSKDGTHWANEHSDARGPEA